MTKLTKNQETVVVVNECVFFLTESTKLLSMILSGDEHAEFIISSDFEKYFLADQSLYRNPSQGYSMAFSGLLKIDWDETGLDFILLPSRYKKKEGAKMLRKIEMDKASGENRRGSLYYFLSSRYAMAKLCAIAIKHLDKDADTTIARFQIEEMERYLDAIREGLIQSVPCKENIGWYSALCEYHNSLRVKMRGKMPLSISRVDAIFLLNLLLKTAGLECRPSVKQKLLAHLTGTTEGTVKGYFHQFKEGEGDSAWKDRVSRVAATLEDEVFKRRLMLLFDKESECLFKD